MRIERMCVSFPDLRHVYVDKEEHLAYYDLAQCNGIEVRVSMSMEEFAAFREWKAQWKESNKASRKLLEAKGDYLERFETI